MQQWATSSTSCLQRVYRHVLYLSDYKVYGACVVYCVERGAVLYCAARGGTVCFILDRMLSGTRRWLDREWKKISASHQDTNPHTGWTSLHICSLSADKEIIIAQADSYIPIAIRPIYLGMVHVVNFPTKHYEGWFRTKAIPRRICVGQNNTGTGFAPIISICPVTVV